MIDWGKSFCVVFTTGWNFDKFCTKQDLAINTNVDANGEIIKRWANFQGGTITEHKSGKVEIGLSFPAAVYGSNVQDLTHNEILGVVETMERFGIDTQRTKLNSLEIGASIKTPWNPGKYLNSVIAWGKAEPRRFKGKNQDYCQLDKQEVSLKIYDKGKQWGLGINLQRYELKIRKIRFLNKYGIDSFSDLKRQDNINVLVTLLIESFKDLIVTDEVNDSILTSSEIKLYEKGTNTRYWTKSDLHRNTLRETKVRYQNLIKEKGCNDFWKLEEILKEYVHKHKYCFAQNEEKTVQNHHVQRKRKSKKNRAKSPAINKEVDRAKSPCEEKVKTVQNHRYIMCENAHMTIDQKKEELRVFFNPYVKGEKIAKTPFYFSGVNVGNLPFFINHELSLLNGSQFKYERLLQLKQYLLKTA